MPSTVSRSDSIRRPSLLVFLLGLTALVVQPAAFDSLFQPAARAASTFTVNSTGDGADSNPADGVCDDGAGHCTLRAAIQQANGNAGSDVINFSIGSGVQQIDVLGTPLPNISDPVVIDATTQPGYSGTPLVQLVGSLEYGLGISVGNSTVRGLAIGGFNYGIWLTANGGNRVEGNYIGTRNGSDSFANTIGVRVTSSNNIIGGVGKGNLISGNITGVTVGGAVSANNQVIGNLIGTQPDGTTANPNNTGVEIRESAASNIVGGLVDESRNVISGNRDYGVLMSQGASGNTVRGNFIGTNAAGSAKLANGRKGVLVQDSPANVIGGTAPGSRNVISGNDVGVEVNNQNSTGTVVQGNFIGTDAGGVTALGNSIGVRLGAPNVTVGSATAAARNVIAGNTVGVQIFWGPVTVQGNFIGAAPNGAPLPNTSDGIQVVNMNPAATGLIGGDAAGAGNTIAFNGGAGIAIKPTSIIEGNFPNGKFITSSIRRNAIYSNVGLGIELIAPAPGNPAEAANDGPTPNDLNDSDVGPNGLLNSPVVTSAAAEGGNTNVRGTFNGASDASFTLDFYANATCDLSGHGEGQAHLGSTTLTTDASGNASFNSTFPASAVGQIITATATDAAGNTSEFSLCNEGGGPGGVEFTHATYNAGEQTGVAVITVTRTLGTAASATVVYSTSDGTAKAGSDYSATSGTLNFAAGETAKTFGVPLTNDTTDEDDETINLTLSNPGGGVSLGGRDKAVLTVSDDDDTPQISFAGEAIVAEGNAGTSDAVFTVVLSAPSGRTVGVFYFTGNGSADQQDFQSRIGSLTFAPGETTKTFSVPVNGDTAVEPDETFTAFLGSPSNGHFFLDDTNVTATGTIWDDDAPGIHFSAPRYAVSETGGSIGITIVRRGDAGTAASVSYTARGNEFPSASVASHRADFTPASGTLQFAPGETEKSFTVLVNDDAFVEGPESVSLQLRNPSDAPPNTSYSASLIINSDDTAPPDATNNPVDSSAFFVRQHYHDFLNREPDAEGLAFWTGEIESCGEDAGCREVKRINVSAAFFLSIEFQETGYLVYRAHKAAFGNIQGALVPITRDVMQEDTQVIGVGLVVGAPGWELKLEQNKQAYFDRLAASERFNVLYPQSMTAGQFVDTLNANAGGALSPDERGALVGELTSNTKTRAQALRAVAEDADLNAAEKNRAFVLMQYFGYLRRNPDASGYVFWLGKVNQFNGNFVEAELVKAFITADEYRNRFGQ